MRRLARRPTSEAVSLVLSKDSEENLGRALSEARSKLPADSRLPGPFRMRKTRAGGLMFELHGEDSKSRADELAAFFRRVLAPRGIIVNRPTATAELRLRGLDPTVDEEGVRKALAQAGGCPVEDIRVGAIRRTQYSLGSLWACLPVKAARKVSAESPITMGWAPVSVEILKGRPVQCFRCLRPGHVASQCRDLIDRSGRCHRCGSFAHSLKECDAKQPRCPLCSDLGVKSANHRLGGAACKPPPLAKNMTRAAPRAAGGSSRVGPTPARTSSPAPPEGSPQRTTEDVEPMEIEDLPAFEFSRPSPSPPPAAVCAVSSEAALGGSVASESNTRVEEKRPRSGTPLSVEDDEEDEDAVAEEPPLPRRLSPREKLKIRLGLCNPEEQRDWLLGRPTEEIARLQRDPEPNDMATARAWGFLDVFDSNGLFVRVATVEEKRTEIFQQWRHRCREAIKSLSPTERSGRTSQERTDPKVSGRGEREAGDGSYLGFKSGFLSSSGSSGKGDGGSSGKGAKSSSRLSLSRSKEAGGTSGGGATKPATPRK